MTLRFRLAVASLFALGFVSGCPGEEVNLEHGFVKIQVVQASNQTSSPFVGTAQLFVAMEYDMCLQNFYATNPNYQKSGADGSLVFGRESDGGEGWADRLCDGDLGGPGAAIDCDVIEIEQELDNSKQLRVTYAINSDDLATRVIKFGPVPLDDLAMCEGGLPPIVRLVAPNPVQGYDSSGAQIWETSSFSSAEAKPNQGGELVVNVARIGG